MKKYTFSKIAAFAAKSFMALTVMAGLNACDDLIYNYEEDCDPPTEEPTPTPDVVKIYVRTQPGDGGTSSVFEANKTENRAETKQAIYVSIQVEQNGTYTLEAVESNPEYKFVRWHDDTNDGDLTEGQLKIENIKAEAETRYSAIFAKIEAPAPTPEVKIYVRSQPGDGGTSRVFEVAKPTNSAEDQQGIYSSISLEENGTYTLRAVESNPDYKFVRWHDDTNDGDLAEGQLEIANLTAEAETRYTALFALIEEPVEPTPDPEPAYFVKFTYTMNMQYTDGFANAVKYVDLYVFNSAGAFVKKYHEDNGAVLSAPNYRMDVSDLEPGTYDLIAWCGVNNGGSFSVAADLNVSKNSDIDVTMKDVNGTSNENLNPLFHGRNKTVTYTSEPVEQECVIDLTKDTNNFNITLQHRAAKPFAKDRFTVELTDNNGHLLYDNSVPGSNPDIVYKPYRTVYGEVATRADNGNYLQVEIATSRLMENHDAIITVTDTETGKTVFSFPIIKWALNFRSANHKGMGNQEYLDREDEYNVMLWLDDKEDGWFGAEILIQDWHVVDDSMGI